MHTVHLLDTVENGFFAAAMGLIFDMYDYDTSVTAGQVAIIDNFFESLLMRRLSKTDKTKSVTDVPYGQLMNMVATDRRWVYKGSLTTPPCTESIYWNVVAKVYPIKPAHLDAFQKLILAEAAVNGAVVLQGGNYRITLPIKNQDPKLMGPAPAATGVAAADDSSSST